MSEQRTVGSPEAIERDVVIVGAGPAGLMAARRLSQAGKSVAVLEAVAAMLKQAEWAPASSSSGVVTEDEPSLRAFQLTSNVPIPDEAIST